MTTEYDLFLSYSSRDREKVEAIARRLQADGVRVWFDQLTLGPGAHIPTAIEEGIEGSRKVAVFLSSSAFGSDWVGVERGAFLMEDPQNRKGRFLPVLLEDCEVPRGLKAFKMIFYFQDPEGGYQELLAAIRRADSAPPSAEATSVLSCPELTRRARQFPRLACPAYLRPAWRPVTEAARGG